MKVDDIISSVAFGLGFVQLYNQVRTVEEIDVSFKNTTLIGILSSILWLVFQYRKYGLNMTTLYTSSGLIVQLYVLNKILVKEKERE